MIWKYYVSNFFLEQIIMSKWNIRKKTRHMRNMDQTIDVAGKLM